MKTERIIRDTFLNRETLLCVYNNLCVCSHSLSRESKIQSNNGNVPPTHLHWERNCVCVSSALCGCTSLVTSAKPCLKKEDEIDEIDDFWFCSTHDVFVCMHAHLYE